MSFQGKICEDGSFFEIFEKASSQNSELNIDSWSSIRFLFFHLDVPRFFKT